jgi:hypothetical protein
MRASGADVRGPPIRYTRADGALLIPGMPKGTYTVRVVAAGFVPVERKVKVSGPTTVDVVLEVLRGRRVSAEIDARYWRVEARRARSEAPWKQILWQDARVSISHTPTPGEFEVVLAPGDWEFRAVTEVHAPAVLGPVRIGEEPEPLVLRFPLMQGASLAGRLRTKGGAPADLLLHLFVREPDGSWRRLEEKETAADEGAWRIQGLAPGRYRLSPTPDGDPVLAEVDVKEGERTLELALPR